MTIQEEEKEPEKKTTTTLPVLTVTKNNAILKNIFLVLNKNVNVETNFVVGRHPYCDIVLSHPSISRFHFRLSRRSISDSLVILDLASVHGTWVNEKKIEPNIQVELNEGDTIRIGGSSRVYRLHWIPVSRAYDTENSFISPSDVYVLAEAKDHEGQSKDESGLFDEINHPQLLDGDTSEGSDDEVINNEIPLEPLNSDEVVENRSSSNNEPEGEIIPNSFAEQLSTKCETSAWLDEILSETEVQKFSPYKKTSQKLGNTESEQNFEFLESLAVTSSHEYSPFTGLDAGEEALSGDTSEGSDDEESNEKSRLFLNNEIPLEPLNSHEVAENRSSSNNEPEGEIIPNSFAEQLSTKYETSAWLDEILSETEVQQFSPYKKTSQKLGNTESEQNDFLESLAATSSHEYSPFTGLNAGEEALSDLDSSEEVCTLDKENFNPDDLRPYSSSSLKIKEKMSKNIFTGWSEDVEQFTPDKENITPNTLLVRNMAKMSKMKDLNGSNLYISCSSENVLSPSIQKNSAEKSMQRQKITRSCFRSHKISKLRSGLKSFTKRVPFQSLLEHTGGLSQSEASSLSSTTKICNTKKYAAAIEVKQSVKEYKKKWHMIVDATCLLKKESRKALELLRGLKGTQITIPGFVIRELDTLNKQGSLLKRTNEAACALRWIEECMADTDWWIHVQSTEEEPMLIPLTPPTTESQFSKVYRRFSDRIANSVFPSWESFFEIVTPKAEDHVLEYALEFRKNTSDAQFVLLSNNIHLKIKAMAEGLICETAEEFRESLVNPFSDRFLWSDSSPRGLTWSCADDVILKERFYGRYMKLGGGKAGMGLKLLLAIAT